MVSEHNIAALSLNQGRQLLQQLAQNFAAAVQAQLQHAGSSSSQQQHLIDGSTDPHSTHAADRWVAGAYVLSLSADIAYWNEHEIANASLSLKLQQQDQPVCTLTLCNSSGEQLNTCLWVYGAELAGKVLLQQLAAAIPELKAV